MRSADILVNSTGTGTIGRINQWKHDDVVAVADSHVTVLRVNEEVDTDYIRYFLTSEAAQQYLEAVCFSGSTNQVELSRRYFSKMGVPCPPLPEQRAIAALLTRVDQAIDAVENSIRAAERLKRALMQNLLTGKLKPDGTWRTPDEFYTDEKFGNVPVGWEVKAIGDKDVCEINPSYKFVKEKMYTFLPMDAINDKFSGVKYYEDRFIDSGNGYTRFREGDILFAKITPCTENGKVALIQKLNSPIGFASTEFIVLSHSDNVDSRFLFYRVSNPDVHKLAVSLMEGSTGRQRVPGKIFRNRIFIAVPNELTEQKLIADKIENIEELINAKQAKITKLQRLKKSLMQNLLTGRVRVSVAGVEALLSGAETVAA